MQQKLSWMLRKNPKSKMRTLFQKLRLNILLTHGKHWHKRGKMITMEFRTEETHLSMR